MRYLFTIAFLLMAVPCSAVDTKTYTVCESGGGCDYTTVQAAETAHNQDLAANDSALIFEIQNTWVSAEAGFTVDGWTTDATRFLTITAVGTARTSATYSTSAYRSEVSSGTSITILENYTVLDGIQAKTTGTAIRTVEITATTGTSTTNCFLSGGNVTNSRPYTITAGSGVGHIVRNCILIDGHNRGILINGSGTGGVIIDNCTIENCTIGLETSTIDGIVRNTIIWGGTTPLAGTWNTSTLSEENYTDAASLDYGACGSCGTGDQVSQSDPFENIGGENYLLASGATAIDAGKDLSADFTDAIGGKTRDANFDKGADEFIAAAGGQKVMFRK